MCVVCVCLREVYRERKKEKNRWLKFTAKSRKHLSTRVKSSKTDLDRMSEWWLWPRSISDDGNLLSTIYIYKLSPLSYCLNYS